MDGTQDPKFVALYLPQFYETDYNNSWWGEGYTEWTACRKAVPLYPGHYQPREPQNDRYYDLSVKENIRWQMETAREYGIDGFAIYHYYSCGSRLLDVPTEIIRDNGDLSLPFFLYWANESWRKNWFGQDKKIIWEQKYGTREDWRAHFDYCLTYFRDDRYIKMDNKPVFAVYNPWNFRQIDDFMACWNRWAKMEGFDGVWFVKTLNRRDKKEKGNFSAVITREPNYTFAHDEGSIEKITRVVRTRAVEWINRKFLLPRGKGIVMLKASYDKIWNKILKREGQGPDVLLGAFCDWDNSPRKGYNAIIMQGATPEKFGACMKQLVQKARQSRCPMIVINAWNEWAEGAYLEPDKKYADAYLQQIKNARGKP